MEKFIDYWNENIRTNIPLEIVVYLENKMVFKGHPSQFKYCKEAREIYKNGVINNIETKKVLSVTLN